MPAVDENIHDTIDNVYYGTNISKNVRLKSKDNDKLCTVPAATEDPSKHTTALGISLLVTDHARQATGECEIDLTPPQNTLICHVPNQETLTTGRRRKRTKSPPAPLKLSTANSIPSSIQPTLPIPASDRTGSCQRQLSPGTADLPTIVLTPTQNTTTKSTKSNKSRQTIYPPGRPPSSVYIRAISTFGRIDRTSIDTVPPTPLRSAGWWDLLHSPLLSKSISNCSRSTGSSPSITSESYQNPKVTSIKPTSGVERKGYVESSPTQADSSSPATLSTFYMIPTRGEAAAYYDHRIHIGTPRLLGETNSTDATHSTADGRDSTQSNKSGQRISSPLGVSVGVNARQKAAQPILFDTRRLGSESVADKTLPRSAVAEVFSAPGEHDSSRDPLSPSPVIGVASAARLQSARSIQHRSVEPSPEPLLIPEPRSHLSTLAKLVTPTPKIMAAIPFLFPPFPTAERQVQQADVVKNKTSPDVTAHEIVPSPELPPLPPIKDSDNSYTRNHSPDIEAGPSTFPAEVKNCHDLDHRSASDEIKPGETAGPGLAKRLLQSDLLKTHYKSPCRPAGKDRTSRKKWWRRHLFALVLVAVTFMFTLLTILLALFMTRSHRDMPVQSTWLNLTGFPPLQTGVATVAQPDLANDQSSCVQPSGLWSCALPISQQVDNIPTGSLLPIFRFEVRFRNGTLASNSTQTNVSNASIRRRSGFGALESLLRLRRDTFSGLVYQPFPLPPQLQDQLFLGNTTDNITSQNFAGEETPYYISLLSTSAETTSKNATERSTVNDTTASIPPAVLSSNGSAGPGQLYPLVTSQPLQLYDRGLSTEHYGFYTYFDRSILFTLPSAIPVNSQSVTTEGIAADTGGATLGASNALCTFSQTRFIVKIWTRLHQVQAGQVDSSTSQNTSSAFDFEAPGSFSLPVSISLDRHGGAAEEKGVYCYGVDASGNVQADAKALITEARSAGGLLVNPAEGAFTPLKQGQAQGIDGGAGGCSCTWQNWS